MKTARTIRRRGVRFAIGVVAVLLALLAPPLAASAHPLDIYLQASYLTFAPDTVTVELDLSPGVLVAPDALAALDPIGDEQITQDEGRAYAEQIVHQLVLRMDDTPLPLAVTSVEVPPYLNIQTGYGMVKIFASASFAADLTGTHQIFYENRFAPTGAAYQVNAFVAKDAAMTLGKPTRDSLQQQIALAVTSGGAASPAVTPVPLDAENAAVAGASAPVQQLLARLAAPQRSPWLALLGVALAALLGGLHALTPGHGKTLMAAYLIGSRGTVRDAVLLGGVVTLTHTASVLLFGALALFASQTVAAGTLAALLEWCAALLVIGLGARLTWVRWRARNTGASPHAHPHPHRTPAHSGIRPGGLLSLGLAGGALPCPEALAIMLVAVGVGQIGLGLGLIVSFSLGLAAVLIAVGVVLVRAENRLQRYTQGNPAWQRWLPLISAVIVLGLGVAMLVSVLRGAALPAATLPITAGALALFGGGYGLALLLARGRQPQTAVNSPETAPWLPARYQTGRPVSSAPMAAADLRFDASGAVAWDAIWTDFCDLALAGGPPHRGTLLEAPDPARVRQDPAGYARVQAELARGLALVTGLAVVTDGAPGWIGLRCADEAMALWLLRAITVENVAVRREGAVLWLPAGPDFRLEHEIKNVVTVAAKTVHYWTEHLLPAPALAEPVEASRSGSGVEGTSRHM